MSELKTNKISTNDQNNVAIDNALGLKSYTTTQRDALTSVAGDLIYNTTDSKVQVYSGSAWENVGASLESFEVEYLVVAGGGGGGGHYGGAGGAGGLLDDTGYYAPLDTALTVSIGGGGGGGGHAQAGGDGGQTTFHQIICFGGGSGGARDGTAYGDGGGSGGGGGGRGSAFRGRGMPGQGNNGQSGVNAEGNSVGGGGGGAGGAAGTRPAAGNGVNKTITGSTILFAQGGQGGTPSADGNGGGSGSGKNGDTNTGGGGGGGRPSVAGGSGGSGRVVLKYLTADISSYSQTGLTIASSTSGDYTILDITSGTGTITFS
jgi:hypothetical protein